MGGINCTVTIGAGEGGAVTDCKSKDRGRSK